MSPTAARVAQLEAELATAQRALDALAEHHDAISEELQQAIRARNEFLVIASHELRTPLTALTLQVQALERLARRPDASSLDERVRERVSRMAAQVGRLARLVDELLDVSRLTTGAFTFQLEDADLAAIARDVAAGFREDAARAGCAIVVDAPARVVGRWDRARLEQVVANLVDNAIKYGAGAPVHVRVVATPSGARLTVRDRGQGVPPAARERIFERFERAVSDRNYGGFGLGLWICRQIVEGLGGTIQLDDDLPDGDGDGDGDAAPRGASFTVTLPTDPPPRS